MTRYIDAHRDLFGVEPICRTLAVAPSTYDAAKSRLLSARALRDAELKPQIERVHEENLDVYGVRKVWRQLRREGPGRRCYPHSLRRVHGQRRARPSRMHHGG